MSASLALIKLRTTIQAPYSTKGSSLTWVEEDYNFILLGDALLELQAAASTGFAAYDNGTTYSSGTYVSYQGNIYKYINAVPQSGITPGTDPLTWEITSVGLFTHQQNTDEYLAFGTGHQVSAIDIYNFINAALSPEFTSYSTSINYVPGNTMTTGGIIYLCHTATSGSFDSSKWTIIGLNTSAFSTAWSGGLQPPTQDAVYDIVVSPPIQKTNDYTFAIGDINKSFEFDKVTAIVGTIPLNASVAFPIGTIIYLAQTNTGQLSIAATGGVTLVSADSYTKLRVQDSCAYIHKIGTDTWRLVGDLTS